MVTFIIYIFYYNKKQLKIFCVVFQFQGIDWLPGQVDLPPKSQFPHL